MNMIMFLYVYGFYISILYICGYYIFLTIEFF